MEKNKIGMIAIIVLLVVMFLVLGVGFVYTINLINKTKQPVVEIVQTEDQSYSAAEVDLVNLSTSIVANLLPDATDSKEHIAMVEISIGLYPGDKKDKDAKKEYEKIKPMLTEKEAIIRHYILQILKNKTYKEMKKPDCQSQLSQEILTCLQDLFKTNVIVEIYIPVFNIQ